MLRFIIREYSDIKDILNIQSGCGGGGENNCSGNYDYSELFKAFAGLSTQQATFKSTKHLTLLSQNGRNLINIYKILPSFD